ncbi:non-ribosomal peptide synthetase [Erwinia sp. ErVv1]|uniref:non-ribosomal peptide synthetase n=1 Tax=Erwinia sp. ErVv1 TaxID=1603299 RepID=UPI0008298819|nr:non-ribosomal peptide synthetase [Erwinia sp. ErVv1]
MSYYPLTSVQQAVWLDQLLTSDTPCYNIGARWLIEGKLDIPLLCKAIMEVAEQHDALQITLKESESDVTQTFIRNDASYLEYHDVSQDDNPEEVARSLTQATFIKPFSLYNQRLWRTSLIKTNTTEFIWSINSHHIIADGTSVSLLSKKIIARYKALLRGDPSCADDSKNYAQFIIEDGAYLTSSRYARDREWWLTRFNNAPPSLLERRSGFEENNAWPSAQITRRLTLARYQQLTEYAHRYGASPMHFLSALIACWFSRQWQTEAVTLGVPVHNRARHKQTLGMFSSMIPVRLDTNTANPFSTLVKQVAGELRRSYRHQRFPIAELNRELRLSQQGRRQLYDLSFSLETFPTDIELNGSPLKVEALQHGYEQTPLAVYLRHYHPGDDPVLECNANEAWFSRDEGERIADRLLHLIAAILDAPPEQPMALLPLLLPSEQHSILNLWNDTAQPWHFPQGIHRYFERQVALTPQAVALCGDVDTLSYAALNQRANQLAEYLRDGGIKADDRVALCVERSAEMVVALLAILKSGGAYVPLDPDYPADRLQHMLTDCGAKCLLIDDAGQRALSGLLDGSLKTLHVQRDRQNWRGRSVTNLPDILPDTQRSLAYVIYTSGSTGKPKGVMNEHLAVMNRLLWMQETYRLTSQDTVLQKTPFSFDVSVWEFFWPLMAGARLAIAKPGGHQDPAYLSDIISRCRVTTLHFVPSMLQLFLRHGVMSECARLQRVFCSGEALPLAAVKRFHHQLPLAELHNLYGPTEAAVDVSFWHCRSDDPRPRVPIGKPVANTRLYILDARLQPVPPGVSGELHIGGIQVARGYLNREALSRERFIPDPFSDAAGARLYKTGDLARWLEDGSIEYLGRNDFQVKIHGLRIELGEIEQALRGCQGVDDAVVLACDDRQGDKRLVAWVATTEAANAGQWREQLSRSLPSFMIPACIVPLAALPLSPNGKLDRRALPPPTLAGAEKKVYQPAVTEQERILAVHWADLLEVPAPGLDDDFFELGGHSLHGIQLMMRLKRQGLKIDMKALYAHTTLRAQAAFLARNGQDPEACGISADNYAPQPAPPLAGFSLLQPLNQHRAKDTLWTVHPAAVGCEIYQDLATRLEGEMNVTGVSNYNLFNRPHIPTLAALASYYLQHIQQQGLPVDRPVNLLGWSLGGLIALEMAVQLEQLGYRHIHVCLLDTLYRCDVHQQIAPGMLATLLSAIGLDEVAVKRAIQAEETELNMNAQALSGPLNATRVTLFKATQFVDLSESGTADGSKVLALSDNGLGQVCPHLRVIPLAENHHSMIHRHDVIIPALLGTLPQSITVPTNAVARKGSPTLALSGSEKRQS